MNINHHCHHHHHLFLKRQFLLFSARVRRFSRYEASSCIPEHCPFRVQTKLIHIIFHTFFPSLPAPTRTSHPRHHHISTGRHPIISILTFHVPKPPQSNTPHHLSQALNWGYHQYIHSLEIPFSTINYNNNTTDCLFSHLWGSAGGAGGT